VSDRIFICRVFIKVIILIVNGYRPKSAAGRELPLLETDDIIVVAVEGFIVTVNRGGGI
jgi:hypothetical protein